MALVEEVWHNARSPPGLAELLVPLHLLAGRTVHASVVRCDKQPFVSDMFPVAAVRECRHLSAGYGGHSGILMCSLSAGHHHAQDP